MGVRGADAGGCTAAGVRSASPAQRPALDDSDRGTVADDPERPAALARGLLTESAVDQGGRVREDGSRPAKCGYLTLGIHTMYN